MIITRFEDIEGWQMGRDLTHRIYSVSKSGAFSQDYGLRDQICRAAGSVMHNIAEGFDSGTNAEFIRFLRYSQRSCAEVQSELYVALDQKYIDQKQFDALYSLAQQTRAKIGGFIKYLLTYEDHQKRSKLVPPLNPKPITKNKEPRTRNQELGTKN